MNYIKEIGHIIIQGLLFVLPIVIASNFNWESISIGTILSGIYTYLVKKSAIASAVRGD